MILFYNELKKANNIKKDNIKLNSPNASVNAKPNIDNVNNWLFNDVFIDTPYINETNTIPAPIAAPPNTIEANPLPINFADYNIFSLTNNFWTNW